MSLRTALTAAAFGCLASCGGKTSETIPPEQTSSSSCSEQVGDRPVQHACSHTTNGPFENVVGSASLETAPTVDAIHVSYLVEPPTENSAEFYVAFTPSRAGEHLFLLDVFREIAVSEAGEVMRPLFADDVKGCDTARYGEVYTLERNAHYLIRFEALSDAPALLFFEHLATFGDGAWTESCSGHE